MKQGKPVGLACAMKNAGVGVGIPDWGRCKLIVEDDAKVHIYAGASCIGQGVGTVLVQMIVTNTPLKRSDIVYESARTRGIAPDSGDTSGSRQTLLSPVRPAAAPAKKLRRRARRPYAVRPRRAGVLR